MALRGTGSRDRSSSAAASPAPGAVRAAPRRRRRFFRRSEPVESLRAGVPGSAADGGMQASTAAATAAAATEAPAPGHATSAPGPDPHADLLANVALRDLTLVESLLALVEEAERDEQDPDRLAFLFRLDHLATRLRRSSENLLVLAGRDAPDGPDEPVPLLEVVRAAISESADYARVDIGRLPPVAIGPHAADDLSHLLAELLDNALAMSPAHTTVTVSGSGASNTVLVAVDDDGIGLPVQRLADYNTRLAAPPALDAAAARQMGLYVVASLAHRHGVYVQMQARPGGGTSVVAALPLSVLAALPAPPPPNAVPVVVGAAQATAGAGAYASAVSAVRESALTPVQAPVGPRPWINEASVSVGAGGGGGGASVRGAVTGDLRTAAPVANAWTPGPAPAPEPNAGAAARPAPGPAPDPYGEEPGNTPSGLPRRTRSTGWAEPPAPEADITPADPESVFDDLAAFDAGQRAAADAPAWEGPWES